MQPVYFTQGAINVAAELQQWAASPQWQDAADTVAKLIAIGKHGMSQIGLFSTDTYSAPDFFCRQVRGWACFYVARPLRAGDAEVYALRCAAVSSSTSSHAQNEANRRRQLAGV